MPFWPMITGDVLLYWANEGAKKGLQGDIKPEGGGTRNCSVVHVIEQRILVVHVAAHNKGMMSEGWKGQRSKARGASPNQRNRIQGIILTSKHLGAFGASM